MSSRVVPTWRSTKKLVLACTSLVVFMLLHTQILCVPSNEINKCRVVLRSDEPSSHVLCIQINSYNTVLLLHLLLIPVVIVALTPPLAAPLHFVTSFTNCVTRETVIKNISRN